MEQYVQLARRLLLAALNVLVDVEALGFARHMG